MMTGKSFALLAASMALGLVLLDSTPRRRRLSRI
jgi:hypothetical protein